jgi:Tol biopolymer transport system component
MVGRREVSTPSRNRFGPYEVVGFLGAGGMGEVFRARDRRLSREVAVKVLPSEVLRDSDGFARFVEEARAASALNHPGIVTVHDVGEEDGQPYIVMELVQGENLRQRLARGPVPAREVASLGGQVAEALAAAHERGIVHRDLKPENVVVTPEGRAKILDFGLARRALVPAARPGDTVETRLRETEEGLVVGTVDYMSPEQVRGEPVDGRSDVFSLGALLFELLAGRPAFSRATPADTMVAVLNDEAPDLPDGLPPVDPGLERIVRRCLEKAPGMRFQSARDVGFALEALGTSRLPRGVLPATSEARPRRGRRVAAAAALVAAGGALFAAGWLVARGDGRAVPPELTRLTFSRGSIRSARFGPDGKTVVFGAAWDGAPIRLHVAQPGSPEPQRAELPDADVLSVSANGEMALCVGRRFRSLFEASGMLARAPIGGRAPREVLEAVREADWGPDGETLAVVRDVDGATRVEMPIGTVLYRTEGWVSHPRVSRDGTRVAFVDHPLRWDDRGSVAVVSRDGTVKTLGGVWQSAGGLAWSPSGRELWYSAAPAGAGRELRAVDLDGRERPLLRASGNLTLHDVSPDGRVLVSDDKWRRRVFYRAAGAARDVELSWLDWTYPRGVSSDWSRLLFDELGDGGGKDYAIYIRTTDGGPATRLGRGNALALSPDGKWVLSATVDTPAKLVLLPSGAGSPRALLSGALDHRVAAWLPDGRRFVFGGGEPGAPARLYVQDLEGSEPRPIGATGTVFAAGAALPVSPDGRFVLAAHADGTTWIQPLDGGEPARVAGLLPDERVVGWADGGALFAVASADLPARLVRLDPATGSRKPAAEIWPQDPAGVVSVGPILVRPDGRALVYGCPQILSDLYVVDGLM